MRETIAQGPLAMAPGSLLRIDDGAGALIHVREGEIWLTEEGSRKDHVLGAGQMFRIERDGATLAHAFRRSVINVSAPASRRSGR
jgi:Protein of unknown function (DUF2917)